MLGFEPGKTRPLRDLALLTGLTLGLAAPLASAQEADLDPATSDGAEVVTLTRADREALRAAREDEIREVLGLEEGEAVPDRRDLSDDQRDALRAAREDRIRETLGLADDVEVPDRRDLSDDQRALLREARQDRVRETLGLADDVIIERPSRPEGFERPDRFDRPERPRRGERFGRGR